MNPGIRMIQLSKWPSSLTLSELVAAAETVPDVGIQGLRCRRLHYLFSVGRFVRRTGRSCDYLMPGRTRTSARESCLKSSR